MKEITDARLRVVMRSGVMILPACCNRAQCQPAIQRPAGPYLSISYHRDALLAICRFAGLCRFSFGRVTAGYVIFAWMTYASPAKYEVRAREDGLNKAGTNRQTGKFCF